MRSWRGGVVACAPKPDGKSLHIAHVTVDLPTLQRKPGGVAVFVDRLAHALALRGHVVDVLTCSEAPPGRAYRHARIGPDWVGAHRAARSALLPLLLNGTRFGDA